MHRYRSSGDVFENGDVRATGNKRPLLGNANEIRQRVAEGCVSRAALSIDIVFEEWRHRGSGELAQLAHAKIGLPGFVSKSSGSD